MKRICFKTLTVFLAVIMTVLSFSAYANEQMMDLVINFSIDAEITDTLIEGGAELAVYNHENTAWLDTEICNLSRGMTEFSVNFSVPQYEEGTQFDLRLVSGGTALVAEGIENAQVVVKNGDSVKLIPAWNREAFISVEGIDKTFYAHCFMGDELYVTTDLLSALGINYKYTDLGMQLTAEDNNALYTFDLYTDNIYAVKGGEAYNLNYAPFKIGEFGYVPLSDVATYFACSYTVVEETPYKRVISLKPTAYKRTPTKAESYINSKNITSRTDYLVWVSKSEYTVYTFIGSNGNWKQVAAFPCAIGAPSTPTVEGSFEYIQYQTRWQYPGYYCGPIMRFYRGYALHSTLIRNNGTPYDNRVGVKISHGCIRLRPENIKWLVDYVPMYSRIYVTA